MSHITLRVYNNEGKKVIGIRIPNLFPLIKAGYHKTNDFFGIQEGTSDVAWWWGFLSLSGLSILFALYINILNAGL